MLDVIGNNSLVTPQKCNKHAVSLILELAPSAPRLSATPRLSRRLARGKPDKRVFSGKMLLN